MRKYIFLKLTLVTFLKVWPSWHMFPVTLPSWHFALLFLPLWHHSLYPRDNSFFTLVTGVRIHIFSLTLVTFLPWPSWHKDYIPSWHEKTATLVTIYPHPYVRLLNGKAHCSYNLQNGTHCCYCLVVYLSNKCVQRQTGSQRIKNEWTPVNWLFLFATVNNSVSLQPR